VYFGASESRRRKRQDTKNRCISREIFKKTITMKITCILIVFQFNHGCVLWSRVSNSVEGDYVIEDFQFEWESLPKLNLHYRTIGKPTKGTGKLITQILIKHGTTGSGEGF
jgi:homoserine O-acetyltransferase